MQPLIIRIALKRELHEPESYSGWIIKYFAGEGDAKRFVAEESALSALENSGVRLSADMLCWETYGSLGQRAKVDSKKAKATGNSHE